MALHHPNQIRAGWGLELALGDFLNAVGEVSTRGALDQGLGVGWTEIEVGDNVGLADSWEHPSQS